MKKNLLVAVATAISLSLCGVASAATITGNFSLTGTDWFTSTSVTFPGAANIGGDFGDFTILAPCTGCVTMNVGTLSTSTALPALIYTATEGAISSTFTLNPPSSFVFTPGTPGVSLDQLVISGSGLVTLSGFEATAAIWSLTTQGVAAGLGGGTGTFTFSATLIATPTAVPLPGALSLFATGIAGLMALGRRRKRSRLESGVA